MLNHRAIFLPIMVVTLPLPAQVTQYFPHELVSILQWFAFWTFSALLTIPWLLCIYQVHLDRYLQHVVHNVLTLELAHNALSWSYKED